MSLQTLNDYVWNMGDKRKYYEWANGSVDLELIHPDWTREQLEAASFRTVFPELTLPECFKP
jgi:hypothetical protein